MTDQENQGYKHWSYKVPAVKRPHRDPMREGDNFGWITKWAFAPIVGGIAQTSNPVNGFDSEADCLAAAEHDWQNRIYNEIADKVDKAAAEWRAKWPDHCKACGGWGLFVFYESHGFRHGPSEQLTDPCEALPAEQCHRCGQNGLSEDGDGPCQVCGWNYDDGMPTL